MEASPGTHNHISFPEVVVIIIIIININISVIPFVLCCTSLLPETQIILAFLSARGSQSGAAVNSSGVAECPLQGQEGSQSFH